MPGKVFRIYGPRRVRQYRNVEGPLGSPPAYLTVFGTWFSGIAIGIVLLAFIALPNALGNTQVPTARNFTSDSDVVQNAQAQTKTVQAGLQAFQQAGCIACHANNGKSYAGIGPQLSLSNNAGDISYVHTIVRNGLYPMPAYSKDQLTDQQLYDITAYIRSIRVVNTSESAMQ